LYSNAGIYTVSLAVSGPGGDASIVRSGFITVSLVPSSTMVMRVAPTTAMANVGTPMTVSVDISNVTNLGSFQFTLAYNPSLVQVQAVSLAEFPSSTGRSFGPVGPTIDNTAGTASFGAMSLGSSPAGPNGIGRLAYVRLLPLAAGTSGLHLSGTQVSDIQSNPLSLVTQDGSLTITANKGDFDGDSDIDILDVQRIAYRWGTHTGDALYLAIYDMDGDGDIDILDVQYVAYRWGTHFSASMQTESIPDSSLAAAQTVSMSVRPANGVIFAGQSFTTSVVISNVSDLGSFQFTLGYSPTVVQVLSVTLGTLPGSTGRTFMTLGPTISATNGTVSFGAFSLGTTPVGANGDGAVAIMSMKALTASQSSLALLEGLVGDRQANPESLVLSGTSLRIVAPKLVYLPIVVR
jgi:PKD repeat protein